MKDVSDNACPLSVPVWQKKLREIGKRILSQFSVSVGSPNSLPTEEASIELFQC